MNFFAFLEGSTYVVSIGIKKFSSFLFPLALFGTWKQVVFGLYWPYFPEFSKIGKFFFVILKYPQGVTKHHIKPGRGTPGGWEIAGGNFTTIGRAKISLWNFSELRENFFEIFSPTNLTCQGGYMVRVWFKSAIFDVSTFSNP